QTWTNAYWPDGSIKWTGHALAVDAGAAGPFRIEPGNVPAPKTPIKVDQDNRGITVNTGALTCEITKAISGTESGSPIPIMTSKISSGDKVIANGVNLVCIREDRSEYEDKHIIREETYFSRIDSVTVEQSGPVRAVLKFTGMHQQENGGRSWLPFVMRLYF